MPPLQLNGAASGPKLDQLCQTLGSAVLGLGLPNGYVGWDGWDGWDGWENDDWNEVTGLPG